MSSWLKKIISRTKKTAAGATPAADKTVEPVSRTDSKKDKMADIPYNEDAVNRINRMFLRHKDSELMNELREIVLNLRIDNGEK